LLELPKYSCLS